MRHSKCVLIFLSILCTVNILNACGRQTASEHTAASRNNDTPLDYYIWSDEQNYISEIVETYNSIKGWKAIKMHVIPAQEQGDWIDDYNTKANCDILDMKGNDDLLTLTEKGALLPLNSFLSASDLDFSKYSGQFYETEIEGQYYALPQRSTCWALYYNKDIFDDCRLTYPDQITWDEMLLLAKKIEDTSDRKLYGCFVPDWMLNFSAVQQDEYLISDDLSRTTENLKYLQQLYSGDYGPDFNETNQIAMDSRYLFGQGKTALMVNGEWLVNMLRQDEEEGLPSVRWGVAPLPVPDDSMGSVSFGMYQFSAISASCKNPEAAFEFLSFLCGQEGATIMASNSIIPAYTTDEIIEVYKRNANLENADVFFKGIHKEEQLMWKGYDKAVTAYRDAVKRCVEDGMSAEQSMTIFFSDLKHIYQ